MKYAVAFLVCLFSLTAVLPAQQTASGVGDGLRMALGGNLETLDDWSKAWVFKDCFKLAREWMTRAAAGSEWESGQRVPVDSDGWPLRAPFQVNGGEHYPHTLMPLYAPGVYTVRFRGAGRIELIAPNGGGRQVIASAGGTTEKKLRFNPTLTDNMLYLELRASSAAEPVRDIEVVAPGQDTDLQSKPFHPTFVASLAPYKTLRFMDWMKTNLTALERWDQRSGPRIRYCVGQPDPQKPLDLHPSRSG